MYFENINLKEDISITSFDIIHLYKIKHDCVQLK